MTGVLESEPAVTVESEATLKTQSTTTKAQPADTVEPGPIVDKESRQLTDGHILTAILSGPTHANLTLPGKPPRPSSRLSRALSPALDDSN